MRPALPLLLLLLLLPQACATPDGRFGAGSVLRTFDNDSPAATDDQYTSGLSLSFVSKPAKSFEEVPLPKALGRALEAHWPVPEDDERFVIYSLSHRIFTPTDLSARDIVEDDLPYTALLYGTATVGSQGPKALSALSLSVGIAGPWALGEEVQSTVHDWIGSRDPEGWDNQLDNELLLNVGAEHRRRLVTAGRREGWGADLLGALSGSLGNLQSQATVASTVRAGWRVPQNFHMQSSFLTEESLGLRPYGGSTRELSLYGFAGFAATGLLNAIWLDGNTFEDSHRVDHDHHVLRGSVGMAMRKGPLLVSAAFEEATLPWDHPDGLDEERFLRLGVSWDF